MAKSSEGLTVMTEKFVSSAGQDGSSPPGRPIDERSSRRSSCSIETPQRRSEDRRSGSRRIFLKGLQQTVILFLFVHSAKFVVTNKLYQAFENQYLILLSLPKFEDFGYGMGIIFRSPNHEMKSLNESLGISRKVSLRRSVRSIRPARLWLHFSRHGWRFSRWHTTGDYGELNVPPNRLRDL